ncbi:hypothetical protein BDV09DRAFT_203123 [Aspergillus tetrazonus]
MPWYRISSPVSSECLPTVPDGPVYVTADCIDSIYDTRIVTSETDKTLPRPHRKATGFFQLVYPLQNSTAEDDTVAFGFDSGAYTIQTSAGVGYRGDAAAAKFSKEIAREYYGDTVEQIYGYIYGGSEYHGVWDGGLALIQAIPISNPNNFCIRAVAGLVLGEKADQVIDAVRRGGSGNAVAGLEEVERLVLLEATALGMPLVGWEDFEGAAKNRTKLLEVLRTLVIANVKAMDPTYVDDFWSTDGYLGTEDSELGQFFRDRLVEFNATVEGIQRGADNVPVGITLNNVPEGSPSELEFTVVTGDQQDASFTGYISKEDRSVFIYSDNNATVLDQLEEGVQLQADNRWYPAVHTWHRNQVPSVEDRYYGYGYPRRNDGKAIYPQRDILLARRVMVMNNLADYDAFPWHADWYKGQVNRAVEDGFEENYHGSVPQSEQHRIVDFSGLYQQLLRDLSAWTEKGIKPPSATRSSVENSQVELPGQASRRGGIQPVVKLTAGGGNRTEVNVGTRVIFTLEAEVPPATGKIVSVEWDWEGTGNYAKMESGRPSEKFAAQVSYSYNIAGTYVPAVRVASHRDGDPGTPFARALNLGRVRVVVN